MKDNRNIFDNMDDNSVGMISDYFPVLTDKEKDRIFLMSERKLNKNTSEQSIENDDVVEIENYSRPVWHRYLGMAAAFVIAVIGIGGGGYLMHSMKKTAPEKNNSEIVTESATTVTQVTSTNATVSTTTTTNNNVKTVTSIVTIFTDIPNTDIATENNSDQYNNTSVSTETTTTLISQDTGENNNDEDLSAIADEILEQYPEIVKIEMGTYYSDQTDAIKFKYQFDNNEITYYHIDPNIFPDMDSLKSFYHTMVTPSSNDLTLFGPEYTSDELPEGSMFDDLKLYRYITYDGKLYGSQDSSDISKFNTWSQEPAVINNVIYDGDEAIEFTALKSHTMFNYETSSLGMVSIEFRLEKDRSTGKWMISSYHYAN